MASIAAIRAALAERLDVIPGVNATGYIKGSPMTPAVYVYPGSPGGGEFTDYHLAMGHRAQLTFTVRAIAGSPIEEAAQMKLDEMLEADGDSSVRQALEADTTLGGIVDDVVVLRSTGYVRYQANESQQPQLAAEWEVNILR